MVFCLKKYNKRRKIKIRNPVERRDNDSGFAFGGAKKVDVAFLHMSFFVGKRVHVHTGAIVQRVMRAGERMDVKVTVSGRVRVAEARVKQSFGYISKNGSL